MSLKSALMRKMGLTSSEADKEIQDAREELSEVIEDDDLDEAFDFCMDRWGLESDYLEELIY